MQEFEVQVQHLKPQTHHDHQSQLVVEVETLDLKRDSLCTFPTKGNGTPSEDELMVELQTKRNTINLANHLISPHINNQAYHRHKSLVPHVLMSLTEIYDEICEVGGFLLR